MPKAFIVHGPAGCGKSQNAKLISLKLTGANDRIVDPWDHHEPIRRGYVHLTVQAPHPPINGVKVISYKSLNLPKVRR